MRRLAFFALAAAAVFVPVAGAAHARGSVPALSATVGPGFSISLRQNGRLVKSLPAGTYRVVVADRSPIHNFVVERSHGGRFEKTLTSVPFTGTKTVTVTLGKGQWEFYCAPHESSMHGDFTIR